MTSFCFSFVFSGLYTARLGFLIWDEMAPVDLSDDALTCDMHMFSLESSLNDFSRLLIVNVGSRDSQGHLSELGWSPAKRFID